MLGGTFGQSFHRDFCNRREFSSLARGTFGESFYRGIYVFGSSFGFRPGVRSVRHYIEERVFSCVLPSEPIIARSKNHEQLKSKCYGCYGVACWRRFGDRAQAPHFIDLPPLP